MVKVTMGLTDQDTENAARIQDFTQAKSRAYAVSIALSMTAFLVDNIMDGAEILLRNRDNSLSKVVMAELKLGITTF
jgi:hypothetical protein